MLNNIYLYITTIIKFFRPQDLLDILIVAFVIYQAIRFLRETRAVQLIKGIIVLFIVLQLSSWLNLHVINYLMINAMQVGLIALIIVFQPELRRALERMGRSNFSKFFNFDENAYETVEFIVEQICNSADTFSKSKTGALIVIERSTKLGDIIKSGIMIDSKVRSELIINIFEPNTPLHDGAIVIRDDRIVAAACFLPLTQNFDLNIELGTRHRAALGMTESSDAIVIVVSEETGKISLALDGSLTRNLTSDSLKKALNKFLSAEQNEKTNKIVMPWKTLKM